MNIELMKDLAFTKSEELYAQAKKAAMGSSKAAGYAAGMLGWSEENPDNYFLDLIWRREGMLEFFDITDPTRYEPEEYRLFVMIDLAGIWAKDTRNIINKIKAEERAKAKG